MYVLLKKIRKRIVWVCIPPKVNKKEFQFTQDLLKINIFKQ